MTYAAFGWFGFDFTQSDYPDIRSGGDYEKFNQWNWSKGEIYVYRFEAYVPRSLEDAWMRSWSASMPLVRAFIQSMPPSSRGTDIIAIAMNRTGQAGLNQVEIIFKDAGWAHTGGDRAGETLDKMKGILLDAGYDFELKSPAYAVLGSTREAKAATTRWLGAPVIWSAAQYLNGVGGTSGMGKDEDFKKSALGLTKYGDDGKGHWVGSALATTREITSRPIPQILPPDGTETRPVEPESGSRKVPSRVGPDSGLGEPETDWTPWVIGGVALASAAAYYALRKAGEP